MNRRKKWATAAGLLLIMLAGLYFVGIVYFTDHFYRDTKVNGADFSWATVEDVEKYLSSEVGKYSLTVIPREGENEVITADDISLHYVSDGSVQKLVEDQDRFMWPAMFEGPDELTCEKKVEFDRKKAEAKVFSLECIKEEGKHGPKDAFPEFDGESFKIIPEVYGTLANKTTALHSVYKAVPRLVGEVDLEEAGCYTDPERLSDDAKLVETVGILNKYLSASITYKLKSGTEVVDRELILDWLSWDDELNVALSEEGVRKYLSDLGKRYNKVISSTAKTITTPTGKVATVSGGPSGWRIDEKSEKEKLLSLIKAGETVTREPYYTKIGAARGSSEWGNTYIELDLSNQYMWCIIGGNVAMESDVITGAPDGYHNTPAGIFHIMSMRSPAVLVGRINPATGRPAYVSPVDYWMQITSYGIGFHDASWQTHGFGGSQYRRTGSHGCINMPKNAAATLYSLAYIGMPVVIHY